MKKTPRTHHPAVLQVNTFLKMEGPTYNDPRKKYVRFKWTHRDINKRKFHIIQEWCRKYYKVYIMVEYKEETRRSYPYIVLKIDYNAFSTVYPQVPTEHMAFPKVGLPAKQTSSVECTGSDCPICAILHKDHTPAQKAYIDICKMTVFGNAHHDRPIFDALEFMLKSYHETDPFWCALAMRYVSDSVCGEPVPETMTDEEIIQEWLKDQ